MHKQYQKNAIVEEGLSKTPLLVFQTSMTYQLHHSSNVQVSPYLSQRLYYERSCRKVLVETTSRVEWDSNPRNTGFADRGLRPLDHLPKLKIHVTSEQSIK